MIGVLRGSSPRYSIVASVVVAGLAAAPAPVAAEPVERASQLLVPGGEPLTDELSQLLASPETWRPMGDVHAVAFSQTGTIAFGAEDGRVRLWSPATATGRDDTRVRVISLAGDGGPVTSIAFDDDDTFLASGSEDGGVAIWDVATRQRIYRLSGHTGPVRAVALSRDGKLAVSASDDGTVRVWKAGELARTIEVSNRRVYAVALSRDGHLVASGSEDGAIKVWDAASGLERKRGSFAGHEGAVHAVAFSDDGKILVSGSADGTVMRWDVPTGRRLTGWEVLSPVSAVRAVAFSEDSAVVAAGTEDGRALLWTTNSPVPRVISPDQPSAVLAVAFHPHDRNLLALGTAAPGPGPGDGTVAVWQQPPGDHARRIRLLGGRVAPVRSVVFDPTGERLVSISSDNQVRLWSLTQEPSVEFIGEWRSAVHSVAFHPSRQSLALGLDDQTIRRWSLVSSRDDAPITGHESAITQVAYSPDGKQLASGSEDGVVLVWATDQPKKELWRGQTGGRVHALAFAPGGQLLATGAANGSLRLWNPQTGRRIASLRGHRNDVTALSFSDATGLMASGSADATVRLWDPVERRTKKILRGHTGPVTAVAFSPAGYILASSSEDGTIRLWETTSGKLLAPSPLTVHSGPVQTLAFHPHSGQSVLVSGAHDGSIRFTRLERKQDRPLDVEEIVVLRGARAGWLVTRKPEFGASRLYRHDRGQLLLREEGDQRVSVPPKPNAPPAIDLRSRYLGDGAVGADAGRIEVVARNANGAGPAYWIDLEATAVPAGSSYWRPVPWLRLDPGKEVTFVLQLVWADRERPLTEDDTATLRLVHATGAIDVGDVALRASHATAGSRTDTAPWLVYGLVAATLIVFAVAGFAYLRVFRNPILADIFRHGHPLDQYPLPQLPEVDRVLRRARRLNTAFAVQGVHSGRWDRAVQAAESPHGSIEAFAEALGAELKERIEFNVAGVTGCVVELPVLTVRFAQASAVASVSGRTLEHGRAVALAQAIHGAGKGPERAIVLDLTDEQDAARELREAPHVTFVVLSLDELRDLIFDPRPDRRLEAALVNQLKVADLSPYQIVGGVDEESMFFGRERELRTMADRSLRNFIVVGARQMGKTTLLQALKRRLDARDDVEVSKVVTLANEDLGSVLRKEVEGTSREEPMTPEEFRRLASGNWVPQKPRLWLVDEADVFVEHDLQNGCKLTWVMRQLSQNAEAYFVLAGYRYLYRAARSREHPLFNFAEVIELGPLDKEDAIKLATVPMQSLGLDWDSPSTSERLVLGAGCRANLIALVCKALIGELDADTRTLTRANLERVVQRDQDLKAHLRIEELLDRIIVYEVARLGPSSRNDIRNALTIRGLKASAGEYDAAFERLHLFHLLIPEPEQEDRLVLPIPFMRERIERSGSLEARIRDLIADWNEQQHERRS